MSQEISSVTLSVLNIVNRKKKAVTLLEVLISAIILAVSVAGILAVFISTRKFVGRSERRVVTQNILRQILEAFPKYVNESFWDNPNNPLNESSHSLSEILNGTTPSGEIILGYANYSGTYTVSRNPNYEYRIVTLNLSYPRPEE